MSVESPTPHAVDQPARARYGMGIAALVVGVASLVAALSFVLLPIGLVGSLVAICLGAAALVRGRSGGTANPGQATAGLVCGILGLAVGIVFAVRLGTFVASNTDVFTRFDNCLVKASGRGQVADCIAQFARGVR